MRYAICWVLGLLLSISSQALANITDYLSTIKSDPKKLYAFFEHMPKGGELHYHLAGGAYPEYMLTLASNHNYCLDSHTSSVNNAPCQGLPAATLNLDSALYTKTLRAWSMQDFTPGVESAHDHFFATFYKFLPVAEDFQAQLLTDVMRRAAKQHELYLEIITSPDNAHAITYAHLIRHSTTLKEKQRILLANPDFQRNIAQTIQNSRQTLNDARRELRCDQTPNNAVCKLTVKFQYLVLREQPLDAVFAQALNGFAAAAQSQEIVGINLAQAEDGQISMHDYTAQMAIFKFLHDAYPNVQISLHAGELTPAQVQQTQQNTHIHQAIFTGQAARIGHGTDIMAENNAQDLLAYMAKKPIPVEINLTSNHTILGIAGEQHPLRQYLAHQVPVVLSTDDEGILRTNLTHQYVDAVMNHHLDYPTIKTINRNALTYSFLPGKSLWTNAQQSIITSRCQHLLSDKCRKWIKNSKKAQLQWQLEYDLALFERRWSNKKAL